MYCHFDLGQEAAALGNGKASSRPTPTRGRTPEPGADRTTVTEPSGNSTFAHLGGEATAAGAASGSAPTTKKVVKKKPGKPVLTAKEKKERGVSAIVRVCVDGATNLHR